MSLLIHIAFGALLWKEGAHRPQPNARVLWALRLLVLVQGSLLLIAGLSTSPLLVGHLVEAMGFCLMVLLAMTLGRRDSPRPILLVWPLVFLIQLATLWLPAQVLLSEQASEHSASVFSHIVLALGGFSSFFVVTLCALLYLWQSHLLKTQVNSPYLDRLPSLLQLSSLTWRSLGLGLVFFTLAIGLGKLSPYLWGIPHRWTGKEVLSVMVWTLYFLLILGRSYFKVHKERFAVVTLIGMTLVICTFAFIQADLVSPGEFP